MENKYYDISKLYRQDNYKFIIGGKSLIKKKLPGHDKANCYYVYNHDEMVFFSYNTPVIYVNRPTHLIKITGLYSKTTRKHISWFCSIKTRGILKYKDCKKAYENGWLINYVERLFIDPKYLTVKGGF